MRYDSILSNTVSKVGIGGHYSKMEEGDFEERYAQVTKQEISKRTKLIEKAFEAGITYFDTTWRNEVDMLAESIRPLGIRDKIHINGMVLGAFSGSDATGTTPESYVDKWLDKRLLSLPDSHFNSFMINAIDENYSEQACENLLEHLEKRRQNGDFDMIGFSCHDHQLARQIADQFPQFELIMLAYNFKNRSFEKAFDGYKGNASFVAMKPLIWYEYGIPFCKINELPAAHSLLSQNYDGDIAQKAIRWNLKNPLITTCVCSVNNEDELDSLIKAGNDEFCEKDENLLFRYQQIIESENHLPFLIAAALKSNDNRRSFQFGLTNLCHRLKYPVPEIQLNTDHTDEELLKLQKELINELKKQGFEKYLMK